MTPALRTARPGEPFPVRPAADRCNNFVGAVPGGGFCGAPGAVVTFAGGPPTGYAFVWCSTCYRRCGVRGGVPTPFPRVVGSATIAADATTCPNCGGPLARVRYLDDVVGCRACRETWYAGAPASASVVGTPTATCGGCRWAARGPNAGANGEAHERATGHAVWSDVDDTTREAADWIGEQDADAPACDACAERGLVRPAALETGGGAQAVSKFCRACAAEADQEEAALGLPASVWTVIS